MSMKSQRRGFRRRIRVIALIAALLAACALLTQCTAGDSAADRDADVAGVKGSVSPEITKEPTAEPTTTPEPTATPIPSDWYIDEEGNIPTDVKMIYPPEWIASYSYCITRNGEGKLVCQMWKNLSLQKEWKIPEEILEVGDFKAMSVYCYTDKKDGEEVFTCFLDYDDGTAVLGPEQELRVFYMQKAGKELLIVYNSYWADMGELTFTTPDGKVFRVYSSETMPLEVYCWQFEKGIYIDFDFDYYCNLIYYGDGTEMGFPKVKDADTTKGTTIFYKPFNKPTIPEWNDVEE